MYKTSVLINNYRRFPREASQPPTNKLLALRRKAGVLASQKPRVSSVGRTLFTSSLLDPSQRPSEPSECNDLLSFFVVQNVAHTDGGY